MLAVRCSSDWLIRNLNSHLRELDFAIQSVTLCVSLITASRPQQPQSAVVSASALLRASDRLQSMHAQGGDVTCSFGALYTLTGGEASTADERLQQPQLAHLSPHSQYERDDDDESGAARSTLPLSASTFLTDYDHFSVDSNKTKPEQSSHNHSEAAAGRADAELHAVSLSSPASPSSPCPLAHASSSSVSSVPVCDVRAWLNESVIESEQYQPTDSHEQRMDEAAHRTSPPANHVRSAVDADESSTWQRMYVDILHTVTYQHTCMHRLTARSVSTRVTRCIGRAVSAGLPRH